MSKPRPRPGQRIKPSNAIVGFPLGQLERINESLHAAQYPDLPFVLLSLISQSNMHGLLGTWPPHPTIQTKFLIDPTSLIANSSYSSCLSHIPRSMSVDEELSESLKESHSCCNPCGLPSALSNSENYDVVVLSSYESVHPSSFSYASSCFLLCCPSPDVTRDRNSSRSTLSPFDPCRKNSLLNIFSVVCPKESKVEASNFKPHAAILAFYDVIIFVRRRPCISVGASFDQSTCSSRRRQPRGMRSVIFQTSSSSFLETFFSGKFGFIPRFDQTVFLVLSSARQKFVLYSTVEQFAAVCKAKVESPWP